MVVASDDLQFDRSQAAPFEAASDGLPGVVIAPLRDQRHRARPGRRARLITLPSRAARRRHLPVSCGGGPPPPGDHDRPPQAA